MTSLPPSSSPSKPGKRIFGSTSENINENTGRIPSLRQSRRKSQESKHVKTVHICIKGLDKKKRCRSYLGTAIG